jgi:hypothetical protein
VILPEAELESPLGITDNQSLDWVSGLMRCARSNNSIGWLGDAYHRTDAVVGQDQLDSTGLVPPTHLFAPLLIHQAQCTPAVHLGLRHMQLAVGQQEPEA